jgi:hypothetical protein
MQKVINEFENSTFIKDHDNIKKLLREVACFANHSIGMYRVQLNYIQQLYCHIILIPE